MATPSHMQMTVQVLERTPRALRVLLVGLDAAWTNHPYQETGFSPYNVVGHLLTLESIDWIPRIRIILDQGVSRPFDPVPHTATIDLESGPPLNRLLDEFEAARALSLTTLRDLRLTESDLDKTGIHPGLGEVTMRQLLSAWAAHDLHHIAQIVKGLSWQCRHDVGPWREYLGVIPPG